MPPTQTLSITTAVLGVLVVCASPVHAQAPAPKTALPPSLTAISPIFGQLVRFSMPSVFVVANEKANTTNYIREAVLKGETLTQWTQMITVTGFKGLVANPQITPESFAVSIAGGFKRACPDSFAVKPLGAAKFGAQDGFVAVVGCGRIETAPDKHGETALLIVVKGSADYYTLQWAERAPSGDQPAVSDTKWQERIEKLKPIQLCAIVPGEPAPYPSCVNRN